MVREVSAVRKPASTNLGSYDAGPGGQLAGSGSDAGRPPGVSVSLPPRPPLLTGREEFLAGLHQLQADGSVPATVVLTGQGGVGKTSVAVEFAHRHLAEVGVAWQLAAEDETVLAQGLAALAGQLSGRDVAGLRDPVESIHAMLAAWPSRWLLIFDNARGEGSVHRFLPPAGRGWVIVTSESQQWPGQVVRHVPVLSTAVAAKFLVSRTGDADEAAAAELADQLDGLPLALEQAAACAQAASMRLDSYLRMFRQRRTDALAWGGPAEHATIAATLSMALSSLENQSPHAAGLLRLLACLAPEPVPVSIFMLRPDLAAALPEEVAASVGPLMGDQRALADAVAALRRYSLISSAGPGLVLVHRLIQDLALNEASAGSAAAYRQAGAVIADAAVPADTDTRDMWQGIAQARHGESGSGGHRQALAASREAARWTGRAGDPAAARDQLAQLLSVYNRVLGSDHPDVLAVRHDLGYWTGEAGDRVAARDQFAELLPGYTRVLGTEHSDVLAARHNLANWTGQAGDPAAARDQYAELLPVYQQVLGTDHHDTLTARHDLAYWTGEAGNPAAARDQFAELLPVYQQVLGTEHRDTLTARHNLANWTGEAGDPAAAQGQFAELLPIKERVLGPGHRSTQATRHSLDSLVSLLAGDAKRSGEVRFAADLFRGAAAAYERYRLPYPVAMIAELAHRARVSGRGRLLDLACGTGQLAFPLRRWFAEVWAVDQEPDMIEVVRAKAAAVRAPNFRPVVSSAETLAAEPEYFELAVVGNAFHRLDRDLAASRIFGWLQPGGHLALCWSSQPWDGEQGWQRALAAALDRWKAALGAGHRIPAGWAEARSRRPDTEILSGAGFELAGSQELAIEHRWTLPELAGLIRSTSFLPASVLGDQAAAFDADLAVSLGSHSDDGAFTATISFVYDLARKPG